jgi:pyruvate/2-oxoglutarate dehydrogenase complex dihydrolipoamide acyltransferase (E2) component
MKMFNKVYAPFSGTVEEVLIDTDGVIISKGQPLFRIAPDERIEVESPEAAAQRRRQFTQDFLSRIH